MPLRVSELWKLPPGKHFDTGRHGCPGLFLLVKEGERKPTSRHHNKPSPGRRSWVARLAINRKRHELGIGSLRDLTLDQARQAARVLRQEVRAGVDPRLARAARTAQRVTFREVAEQVWTERAKGLRNEKHAAQWRVSLENTFGVLGDLPIAEVDSDLILKAIKPIVEATPETGRRTLQRIGVVLEVARAQKLYGLPSPIAAVRAALPKNGNGHVNHFAAIPLDRVGEFMRELRKLQSPSAWAVEFAILTAARTRPVRLMRPDEIRGDVWQTPGEHMKHGRPWDTPLVPRAVELIGRGCALNGAHVFSSARNPAGPLSEMGLLQCARGIEAGATVHGWRSTFTDWMRHEKVDHELQELCLAHVLPGKVRRAYARDMLLKQRREVLERWAAFTSA